MIDSNSLHNYTQLVRRVDELCAAISTRLAGHLACRKGCDACCRHLSLFPVEAAVLAEAVRALPRAQQERLRVRVGLAAGDGSCPLLEDHACLVYGARPIICRTHGLPVLTRVEGEARVDFCTENCRGLESLTGDMMIDVDRLNTALATVNALFLRETGGEGANPRRSMADIIRDVIG